MKYTAHIVEVDRDYNAYVGTETTQVDCLLEAENYCTANKWSGAFNYVEKLVENK